MAVIPITNGRLYVGEYNLSGYTNQMALDLTRDKLETTSIQDGSESSIGGLYRGTLNASGFNAAGTQRPDALLFPELGVSGKVVTVTLDGDTGGVAYTFKGMNGRYSQGGQRGELWPFSFDGEAQTPAVVRGTLAWDDSSAHTSSANGTGYQLGAVGASESLYATLHVLSASGTSPTLDVAIESDDNSGFTSATSRLTFTQATDVGAEWATPVSGAISDDWFRVAATIGGTDPSFTFVVTVGIR